MTVAESRANTNTLPPATPRHRPAWPPAPFGGIDPHAVDWRGFTGLLESWITAPTFTHTHYLTPSDYHQVFDYIFLQLGHLRKRKIAVIVTDTGDGDERDEIRLIHDNKKFKIRPI